MPWKFLKKILDFDKCSPAVRPMRMLVFSGTQVPTSGNDKLGQYFPGPKSTWKFRLPEMTRTVPWVFSPGNREKAVTPG